jgi:hypothetical protein
MFLGLMRKKLANCAGLSPAKHLFLSTLTTL